MFEFSIKSSKNIKELNIIFEDGESEECMNVSEDMGRCTENAKEPQTPHKPKKTKAKESPKRSDSEFLEASKQPIQPIQPKQHIQKSDSFLSFDDLESEQSSSPMIIQKPEIPDVSTINVADELHNLDF